jgi:DNA-binding NarL/FixJ family response regulator
LGDTEKSRRQLSTGTAAVQGARVEHATVGWTLTCREAEVLSLLVVGSSTKQIAAQLRCAESTVEVHVCNIMRKVGVQSRTTLVAQFWMTFGSNREGSTPEG